ncbi:unnamed protein product, partial [Eretmochelys imbricata]
SLYGSLLSQRQLLGHSASECGAEQRRAQGGGGAELFVFTNGEVGNTEDVITKVQHHWEAHRCFSFGIRAGASTALIKGIARAAGSSAELITGQYRMQPQALPSLKRALQPAMTRILLSWDLPPAMEAALLGRGPEVIFPGQWCLIYPPNTAVGCITLQYRVQDQTYKGDTAVRPTATRWRQYKLPVHRLASKSLLLELEGAVGAGSEGDWRQALETGLSSGVVCSLTAYMGVDTERGQPVQGPLVRRDIPLLLCGSAGPSLPPRVNPVLPAPGQEESSGRWPGEMGGSLRGLAPASWESGACWKCLSWFCCIPELIQGGPRCKGRKSCKHGAPPETAPQEERAPEESSLLRLVSLQNVDGSWDLDPWLATVLGGPWLSECLEAANALLGCSIGPVVFRL